MIDEILRGDKAQIRYLGTKRYERQRKKEMKCIWWVGQFYQIPESDFPFTFWVIIFLLNNKCDTIFAKFPCLYTLQLSYSCS